MIGKIEKPGRKNQVNKVEALSGINTPYPSKDDDNIFILLTLL